MAERNDDIKSLFEHLGLDPSAYREVKARAKPDAEAGRWSLLDELAHSDIEPADIPQARRAHILKLTNLQRAERLRSMREHGTADSEAQSRPSPNGDPVASAELALQELADKDPAVRLDAAAPNETIEAPSPGLIPRKLRAEAESIASRFKLDPVDEESNSEADSQADSVDVANEVRVTAHDAQISPDGATVDDAFADGDEDDDYELAEPSEAFDEAIDASEASDLLYGKAGSQPESKIETNGAELIEASEVADDDAEIEQDLAAIASLDDAVETGPDAEAPRPGLAERLIRAVRQTAKAPTPVIRREPREPARKSDFEDAIDEVARAAKAEVRKRDSEGPKSTSASAMGAAPARVERVTDTRTDAERIQAESFERLRAAAKETVAPTPVASAPEPAAPSAQVPESMRPESPAASEQAPSQAPQANVRFRPRHKMPPTRKAAPAKPNMDAQTQGMPESAPSLSSKLGRYARPEPAARAEREFEGPPEPAAASRISLRTEVAPKLRFKRPKHLREAEHKAAHKGLRTTFDRLRRPEKAAVRGDGKLHLQYGARPAVKNVQSLRPETIAEVFARLRRLPRDPDE